MTESTAGIDLHVHSTASDGSVPPEKIPEMAVSANLCAVALTDHDTVAGIAAFLAAARAFPQLEAIAGVELAAQYSSREIHFTGLFIDPEAPALQDFLKRQRQERLERADGIRRRLSSLGYPLTDEEIAEAGGGEVTGRPHFARALQKKYSFSSMTEVFDKLLKRGCPAYIPRKLPPPHAVIEAIHAAGGVAVWAHPVYRQRNERSWVRRIMKKFAPLGLDAAESYYSLFGPAETELITELAAEYGLALSGGSDFHGENTPRIALGSGAGKMFVPAHLLQELKKKKANRTHP